MLKLSIPSTSLIIRAERTGASLKYQLTTAVKEIALEGLDQIRVKI
jgi:hypothetical protein